MKPIGNRPIGVDNLHMSVRSPFETANLPKGREPERVQDTNRHCRSLF